MAKFEAFEDIEAWKKAYSVTLDIYKLSQDGEFSRDFGLRDQLRRASTSVMANIAEGHGRRSNQEFANHLNIARGSAQETQSHLHIARALGYIAEDDFHRLYGQLSEISRMTLALARYLRNSPKLRNSGTP
ncbi:MAG: S23 ribosomal protein [Acidobacteria bacterium OLB17]|nr:MAG: S23 ribosomal protein [Acidobacteria bacterium OLB17]MCZ2390596.1 four helix bundle protein [Acidobacteriota bacterium]